MQGSDYSELLRASAQRQLTSEEEAQLAAYLSNHPDLQASWEEERALGRLLRRLPDAPLASNFTAQVLRLVERECTPARYGNTTGWSAVARLHWVWKAAGGLAAICLGLLSYHQYDFSRREEVAQSVATVSRSVAALSTLDLLENFEAIRRLTQVPQEVDAELLAALQ